MWLGGGVGREHNVHGDGVGFRALDPFPVTFLFFEREELKGVGIRTGHNDHVRIPLHDSFAENCHLTSDRLGVGLDCTQTRIISKGEFEVYPGLLVLKDDFDRHGIVGVVQRIVGLSIVNVRL